MLFPTDYSTPIRIMPASFEEPQRVEASEAATALGKGLRMEVHSAHTEFWADETVPVGKVDVWQSRRYRSFIEPVCQLASAQDHYSPQDWILGDSA